MDIRKVKKLIELLEESGIDELEIREGEESVRISRNTGPARACRPSTPLPPLRSPPRPRLPRRPLPLHPPAKPPRRN